MTKRRRDRLDAGMRARSSATRTRTILLSVIVVGLMTTACGSTMGEEPEVPIQDPSLVAAGEPLYSAECAECHGSDLRGTSQGPSHLSIIYAPGRHVDFAFQRAIQFGSPQHHWSYGPMKSVEGLSDDDIAAITAFVRENQRVQGFEPYPP